MVVNSLNLQSKMAFGFNPYLRSCPKNGYSDREVGSEVLDYAARGCLFYEQIAKKNNLDKLASGYAQEGEFFNKMHEDDSLAARALKEQLGKQIRTYA
ncbi:MAG: hypothetical protein WCG23_03700 [bacterium]